MPNKYSGRNTDSRSESFSSVQSVLHCYFIKYWPVYIPLCPSIVYVGDVVSKQWPEHRKGCVWGHNEFSCVTGQRSFACRWSTLYITTTLTTVTYLPLPCRTSLQHPLQALLSHYALWASVFSQWRFSSWSPVISAPFRSSCRWSHPAPQLTSRKRDKHI